MKKLFFLNLIFSMQIGLNVCHADTLGDLLKTEEFKEISGHPFLQKIVEMDKFGYINGNGLKSVLRGIKSQISCEKKEGILRESIEAEISLFKRENEKNYFDENTINKFKELKKNIRIEKELTYDRAREFAFDVCILRSNGTENWKHDKYFQNSPYREFPFTIITDILSNPIFDLSPMILGILTNVSLMAIQDDSLGINPKKIIKRVHESDKLYNIIDMAEHDFQHILDFDGIVFSSETANIWNNTVLPHLQDIFLKSLSSEEKYKRMLITLFSSLHEAPVEIDYSEIEKLKNSQTFFEFYIKRSISKLEEAFTPINKEHLYSTGEFFHAYYDLLEFAGIKMNYCAKLPSKHNNFENRSKPILDPLEFLYEIKEKTIKLYNQTLKDVIY